MVVLQSLIFLANLHLTLGLLSTLLLRSFHLFLHCHHPVLQHADLLVKLGIRIGDRLVLQMYRVLVRLVERLNGPLQLLDRLVPFLYCPGFPLQFQPQRLFLLLNEVEVVRDYPSEVAQGLEKRYLLVL